MGIFVQLQINEQQTYSFEKTKKMQELTAYLEFAQKNLLKSYCHVYLKPISKRVRHLQK
jgi:hypothetical protein